jgi:hypothetical protein
MSRTKVYGTSQQVIDLGPDRKKIVPIAQDIALARGAQVAEVLFDMAAIRSLQTDARHGAGASVICERAHVQACSAKEGQQAAHLLPGQILVNGLPVWELARTTDPKLASEVHKLQARTQMCFAATNVLPALFNKADTEAEGRGIATPTQRLKPLFGTVVQGMRRQARVGAELSMCVDRQAVESALRSWFMQVSAVYLDAAGRKAEARRMEEARVLATYADSFRVANPGRFVDSQLRFIRDRYEFLS